jgi:hypothetical protein
MIDRSLFNTDHEAFRDSFRRFVEKEITVPRGLGGARLCGPGRLARRR